VNCADEKTDEHRLLEQAVIIAAKRIEICSCERKDRTRRMNHEKLLTALWRLEQWEALESGGGRHV